MRDLDKLLASFERSNLLQPFGDRPTIVDLARALAWLAGVESIERTAKVTALTERIGPADHLIFVVADGLGLNLLEGATENTFLADHLVAELRSVFPSTTATALTSLATGEWPNQHGVTGQWTHLAEIQGSAALLPFVARSGGRLLTHLGVEIDRVFPLPPLMSRMTRDVLAVLPARLVQSISSTYFTGAQPRAGYETLAQALDLIRSRISTAVAPTYTYLYTPRIDAETHFLGVKHAGVRAVVNELDRFVEQLAESLGGRARIVVTADHGLLDAPVAARHAFKPAADFLNQLRYGSSGDDRVLYFHVRDSEDELLGQRLKSLYDDRFLLISVAEAEQHQLFGPGPISPRVRDRFGDALLISSGADVIEHVRAGQVSRRADLNAFHSGLSPSELRVPLVVV